MSANTLGALSSTLGASWSDFGRCPYCRPSLLPRALAAAMPERMRSTVSSHSISAMLARSVAIMRSCGVMRSNAIPFNATSDTRRASSSLGAASKSGQN